MVAFIIKTMTNLLNTLGIGKMTYKKAKALWNTQMDLNTMAIGKMEKDRAMENIFWKIRQRFLEFGKMIYLSKTQKLNIKTDKYIKDN